MKYIKRFIAYIFFSQQDKQAIIKRLFNQDEVKLLTNALDDYRCKLNREGISNYINWWKHSLFEHHDYRDYLKPFTMTAYMNYEEIDYIFSLFKDPLRPCLHAFSGGQLIGMEIMNRLPLISKERPKLAEKIMKFATNPIEQGLAYGVKAGFPNR